MQKKIFILGANGFIGSSLVKTILQRTNHQIYAIDLEQHKLGSSSKDERFHFKIGDINTDKTWVNKHIKICDVIIPLVAIANPTIYVKDPLRVFELDFATNLEIVRQCIKYNKRIIFPSTSEVYGMSRDEEFNEETSPLTQGPINKERWIYSCCKQLMDRLLYAYGTRGKLHFTIFRPFNWIGPLQDNPHDVDSKKSRVVTRFISDIIYGRDLQLVDGGEQRRCFTFIDDGIAGLMQIIENHAGCANGRIFNLGNPKNNCSIRELAGRILELAQTYTKYSQKVKKIKIANINSSVYYGRGYQDLQNRVPAIENARRYLGWQPKVDLDSALRSILDYHLR